MCPGLPHSETYPISDLLTIVREMRERNARNQQRGSHLLSEVENTVKELEELEAQREFQAAQP